MICPNCNCNNPDGAKFCKECGKSMGSGVIDSSKALSTHTNTVAATNPQNKPYSVYWRFNNSREAKFYFIITDRSIIERRAVRGVITDAEYPYSALDPISKHKRYKELKDFDDKNEFNVEDYVKKKLKLKKDDPFDLYEVNLKNKEE